MAGFVPTVREAIKSHDVRLDDLARRVRAIEPRARVDKTGASGAAGRTFHHGSTEDLALIAITGRTSAGLYTAKRRTFDDAGSMIDEPDLTDSLTVFGMGAGAFPGATGFARYCGYYGSPPTPLWMLMSGEWHGFLAKLTSAVDANFKYAWEQVEVPPTRTTKLSSAASSTGVRVKDRASLAYDHNISASKEYPSDGTMIVRIEFDPVAQEFFFMGGTDPDTCETTSGTCA